MKRNIQTTERKKNQNHPGKSKCSPGFPRHCRQEHPARPPAGGSEAGAVQSSHGTQIHLALRWGLSFALNPPVELVTPRGWEEPTGSSLKNNNKKKIRTKKNIKMKCSQRLNVALGASTSRGEGGSEGSGRRSRRAPRLGRDLWRLLK